jgi:hypothetical protein
MASYEVKINEPSIGLTNRTSYVSRANSQNFVMQRGHRGTANLVFTVAASDSYSPTLGTAIYIYNVGTTTTCVWAGSIDSIQVRWVGNNGARFISLTCVSFEQSFDKLRTTQAYAYDNQYAGDIMADLIQRAAGTLPVSVGIIAAGARIDLMYVLPNQTLAQVFASLASDSGLIWGVDPATSTVYMKSVTATPSPFTLASSQLLFESFNFTQTRQNYRNRQSIQIAEDAYDYNVEATYLYTPSTAIFLGNGSTTTFTLPTLSRSIQYIVDTGLPSTQTGTFTGLPANNDTITFVDKINNLTSQVYTFKTTLDNSQTWQVLIGATAAATATNFSNAINADIATAGTSYSLPTTENQYFSASVSSATVTVQTKFPANCASGTLIESCSNFTWAGSTTSGASSVTDATKTWATIPGSDILFDPAVTTGSGPAVAVAYMAHAGFPPSGGSAAFMLSSVSGAITLITAGTTIVVGDYTYTYVNSITNSIPFQLWNHYPSGVAATTLTAELAAAINGTPSGSVSSSTPANPYVTAGTSTALGDAWTTVASTGVSNTPNSVPVSPTSVGGIFCWYTDTTATTKTLHLAGGVSGNTPGAPGDTMTVGATTYTFVAALTNSTPYEILANASMGAALFATRLAAAINGIGDGTTVSSATGPNQSASGSTTGVVGEVKASALFPGVYGNAIGVSQSSPTSTNYWLATSGGSFTTHLAGGADSTLASTSTITTSSFTLASGHALRVVYHRLGGDFIAVENTTLVTARAAIEGTSGRYQTWSSDQRLTTGHALQAVQQGLTTYSTLISTFQFVTDSNLLSAGQVLTISVSAPPNLGALINGTWYVQEVRADLAPGWTNFRYTVTVVNGQMLNYVQFWTNLANNINVS